jgi:hypothetical protein
MRKESIPAGHGMKNWSVWIAGLALATCLTRTAAADVAPTSDQAAAVHATELAAGEKIHIDGRLDDGVWQRARPYAIAYKFAPVTVVTDIPETAYRVIVDGEFLYVGVTCRDPHPKAIWKALARRDTVSNADIVEVFVDPSGQRKFAQVFRVAAGGAIRDGTFFEDSGRFDFSPDFAFESATQVDDSGWS